MIYILLSDILCTLKVHFPHFKSRAIEPGSKQNYWYCGTSDDSNSMIVVATSEGNPLRLCGSQLTISWPMPDSKVLHGLHQCPSCTNDENRFVRIANSFSPTASKNRKFTWWREYAGESRYYHSGFCGSWKKGIEFRCANEMVFILSRNMDFLPLR